MTVGPVHDQRQSNLFNELSAGIRLLIYEAALTDPTRLLHINFFSGEGGRWVIGAVKILKVWVQSTAQVLWHLRFRQGHSSSDRAQIKRQSG
jgi:hypothetical protein